MWSYTACESTPSQSSTPRPPQNAPEQLQVSPTPPPDATQHASGLITQVLHPGRGNQRPRVDDTVSVHFSGWNEKGKRFDGTRKTGIPQTLRLSGVIAGWKEALQLMVVGERRRVWVPDELRYIGRPGSPRGVTVYDVELLAIVEAVEAKAAPPDLQEPPPEANRSASGVAFRYLTRGKAGETPKRWDRVKVDFDGWTANGKLFDSSRKLGEPAAFDMDDVIPGWAEVLTKMTVGDRVRVWIPGELAYQGRKGRPQGRVVFDLALRSVERLPEPPRPPANPRRPPPQATKTRSGLAYLPLARGKGNQGPSADSRVEVHYSAWTPDGQLFDSSVVRGHPVRVPLARMIPGWIEGLQKMVEGDRFVFWIPEELAYAGKAIGKSGPLVYEIELLKVVR